MSTRFMSRTLRFSFLAIASCAVSTVTIADAEAQMRARKAPSIEVHLEVLQSLRSPTHAAAPVQSVAPQRSNVPFSAPSAPLARTAPAVVPQAPMAVPSQPSGVASYQPSGAPTVKQKRYVPQVAATPKPQAVAKAKPAPIEPKEAPAGYAMYQPAGQMNEPVAVSEPRVIAPVQTAKVAPKPKPAPVKAAPAKPKPVETKIAKAPEPVKVMEAPKPEPVKEEQLAKNVPMAPALPEEAVEVEVPKAEPPKAELVVPEAPDLGPPIDEAPPLPDLDDPKIQVTQVDEVPHMELSPANEPSPLDSSVSKSALDVNAPTPPLMPPPVPVEVEAEEEVVTEIAKAPELLTAPELPEPQLPDLEEEVEVESNDITKSPEVMAMLKDAEKGTSSEVLLPKEGSDLTLPPSLEAEQEAAVEEMTPELEEPKLPEMEEEMEVAAVDTKMPELPKLPTGEAKKMPELPEAEPVILEEAEEAKAEPLAVPDLPEPKLPEVEEETAEAVPALPLPTEDEEKSLDPLPEVAEETEEVVEAEVEKAPAPKKAPKKEEGFFSGLTSQVASMLGDEEEAKPAENVPAPPALPAPEVEAEVEVEAAPEPEVTAAPDAPKLPSLPKAEVAAVPVAETSNRALPSLDPIKSDKSRRKSVKVEDTKEAAPEPKAEPLPEPEVENVEKAAPVEEVQIADASTVQEKAEPAPEPKAEAVKEEPEQERKIAELPKPIDPEQDKLTADPNADQTSPSEENPPTLQYDLQGMQYTSLEFSRTEEDIVEAMLPVLEEITNILTAGLNYKLNVISRAGSSADDASVARRVSLRRALAIRSYFIEKGIATDRVNVQALGNSKPDGKAQERADIKITY